MIREQTVSDLGFERLLTLKEVKDILGVSYGVIKGQIRRGYLRAYKVTGEPIRRDAVTDEVQGIRVQPSDLRAYLRAAELD